MEAKLRFIGETVVAAGALVDFEEQVESVAVLQENLAADSSGIGEIWMGEDWWEDSNGVLSEARVESSIESVSNIEYEDGKGDPSAGEPDSPEPLWEEEEDNFWRFVEDEDFVVLEVLSETNEGVICVGEGCEAPSWTGHDPWVLSSAGVDEKSFSMVQE